jgi:hypothetical protein
LHPRPDDGMVVDMTTLGYLETAGPLRPLELTFLGSS